QRSTELPTGSHENINILDTSEYWEQFLGNADTFLQNDFEMFDEYGAPIDSSPNAPFTPLIETVNPLSPCEEPIYQQLKCVEIVEPGEVIDELVNEHLVNGTNKSPSPSSKTSEQKSPSLNQQQTTEPFQKQLVVSLDIVVQGQYLSPQSMVENCDAKEL
ncbi:11499_t:CDS:2, partial [Racocetra fulgida]